MCLKKLIASLLFLTFVVDARAAFDFNSNCQTAYKKIIYLKFPEARALIAAEKKTNPQNVLVLLLDNYLDFYTIFTGNKTADLRAFEKNKDTRLNALEKENPNSPYYLYCRGEINLQWALCHLKWQEYVSGAFEINRAYTLLKECKAAYPDFLPANKSLGMINVMLGLVPSGIKKALSTFGLKGDAKYGVKLMDELLSQPEGSKYAYLYDETIFYYGYVGLDFIKQKDTYAMLHARISKMDDENLLKVFIKAYLEMRSAHTNEAIQTLQNRPVGNYYPLPMLDYYLGLAKLNRQDPDAYIYFERFLSTNKGAFYVKDAYLRLAWFYLLQGKPEKYHQNIALAKTMGDAISEKDKQSREDAESSAMPNLYLLAARVSYDGGYYEKALNYLKDKKVESFNRQGDKIEYLYRLGRIYQELKRLDAAIQNYASVISQGIDSKVYYVPNAALQLGIIFEERKNYTKARDYYNLCLSMKGHQYKNSLDSRAKAGLLRIEGKT